MSKWITDRKPDSSDEQMVFNQFGEMTHYLNIKQGEPWMPIVKPNPYVKPKRYNAVWDRGHECWVVERDGKNHSTLYPLTNKDEHREAAEEIAAIYERVVSLNVYCNDKFKIKT